ncbi:hypothetical protein EIN_269120 [Entamoeba invadens IP1]|uniref:Leucine rich repeat containing protein BspA family protein n=1 Tax=Entamoeba invadens IP1 TaxID=370355 RepID=A0A0A1U8F8_ENTIV|nr:hypothetical protein EIN_269120 [Entamoeba invadens IP1]ELP91116.1 hypothetical protein EIN_269120 [Entamoeba invadens IP1]|eukprot:XP_004257887.1 hypothetical protein EIN_269120 [Entamoeba invadens IP1]
MKSQMDIYSLQIVAKYFLLVEDYINVIQVNKKFQYLTDRFRYNPISISSLKLFPFIETLHLYTRKDAVFPSIPRIEYHYQISISDSIKITIMATLNHTKVVFHNINLKIEDFSCGDITHLLSVANTLPERCFQMSYFTSLNIPDNITQIGCQCFSMANRLQYVTIGRGLTALPNFAFSECQNLKSITLPNTLTKLSMGAFQICGLNSFTFPESVKVIGSCLFSTNNNLQQISFPKNMKVIPYCVCYNCPNLRTVTLPDNLVEIEFRAFDQCNLDKINIPSNLLFFKKAFSSQNLLKQLNFPKQCLIVDVDKLIQNGDITQNDKKYIVTPSLSMIPKNLFMSNGYVKSIVLSPSVLNIEESAFSFSHYLTSVEMCSSVSYIGESAFYYCANLKEVGTLKGVEYIGKDCFNKCSSLESLCFNENVHIGSGALHQCVSLTQLEVPHTNGNVSFEVSFDSIGAFESCGYTCKNIKVDYEMFSFNIDAPTPTDFEYPVGWCGSFRSRVFNSNNLTQFAVPNCVTSLGNSFFSDSTKLKELILSNSVKEIGDLCFSDCHNLERITIPSILTFFGKNAFKNCNKLTSIEFNGCQQWSGYVTYREFLILKRCGIKCVNMYLDSIEYEQMKMFLPMFNCLEDFSECNKLEYISIPSTVSVLGKQCFSACHFLKEIKLVEGLCEIRECAFEKCYSLKNVIFPKSLHTIGEKCFYGNVAMTAVVIPNTIKSLGRMAFARCTNLKSVIITESLINSNSVFDYCYSLSNVTLTQHDGEKCTVFGSLFTNCGSLKTIEIPETIEHIGRCACAGMSALESVVLPENITSIGKNAFSNCTSLKEVLFNNKIKNIEAFAFFNCKSLKRVQLPESVDHIDKDAFSNETEIRK